jgi:hypothetical protein
VSQVKGAGQKCVRHLRELGGFSFSQEIAITEVKGWVTKYSVPKKETHRRTDALSTIPSDSPLGKI